MPLITLTLQVDPRDEPAGVAQERLLLQRATAFLGTWRESICAAATGGLTMGGLTAEEEVAELAEGIRQAARRGALADPRTPGAPFRAADTTLLLPKTVRLVRR